MHSDVVFIVRDIHDHPCDLKVCVHATNTNLFRFPAVSLELPATWSFPIAEVALVFRVWLEVSVSTKLVLLCCFRRPE